MAEQNTTKGPVSMKEFRAKVLLSGMVSNADIEAVLGLVREKMQKDELHSLIERSFFPKDEDSPINVRFFAYFQEVLRELQSKPPTGFAFFSLALDCGLYRK